MKNILLIGFGPHSRKNHAPVLLAGRASGLVGAIVAVDVTEAAQEIAADDGLGSATIPVTLVEPFEPGRSLPEAVRLTLDELARRQRIHAVVVSTEPRHHRAYASWALGHGFSVLLDKPPTIRERCSVDPAEATAILSDFDELEAEYRAAQAWRPDVAVVVHCQRRFHPAFRRMRDLITEMSAETGCPVTSIQSFHSDGQWRMPNELVDIRYHSYDRGYGKGAHSGYHFFDVSAWLIEAGEVPGKAVDSIEVTANIVRPGDFLAQLGIEDYARLFPGFSATNRYSKAELLTRTSAHGEIDAFISLAGRSRGRTMTLVSINLVHNGYSQRGHHIPVHSDLYKGNGRIRQENHIIQQGPFQAIHLQTWQHAAGKGAGEADEHIEMHVFRNSQFRKDWVSYQRLDREKLTITTAERAELPSQTDSRRRALVEFLEYVNGRLGREALSSDLSEHRRGVAIMSGVYQSAAQRWVGGSPVAVVDFGKTAAAAMLDRRS